MNNLYLSIVNQLDNGVILLDDQLKILMWNNWLAQYTGKSEEDVKGLPITEVIPRLDKNIYAYMFSKAILNGQRSFCSAAMHQYFVEYSYKDVKPPRQNMAIRHLEFGGKIFLMVEIHDVANHYERIQKLNKSLQDSIEFTKRLKRFAYYDSLTNIPNRKFVTDRLEGLIEKKEAVFSLLFLDLNGFKDVNDQYGHVQGDQLLQMFSERFNRIVRKQDVFARLGGDEFVLLVENINSVDEIEQHILGINNLMQEPFEVDDKFVSVTASIGYACFPHDGITSKQLLNTADRRMYMDKKNAKL